MDMGEKDVTSFLAWRAVDRQVAANTQNLGHTELRTTQIYTLVLNTYAVKFRYVIYNRHTTAATIKLWPHIILVLVSHVAFRLVKT